MRSVFIAFAFLSAFDISFFGHDAFKICNIAVIGFTNGYIGNCQIIVACSQAFTNEKELTSKLMSFFLVLGIAVGSIIASFGISQIFNN